MKIDPSAKIVIVDDAVHMLIALRRTLTKLGFSHILEATNGKEALAILEHNLDTALIISDWNMEPVDGLALLEAIRADHRLRDLPFILITADPAANSRDKAMAAGAQVILTKPFTAEALRLAISGLS